MGNQNPRFASQSPLSCDPGCFQDLRSLSPRESSRHSVSGGGGVIGSETPLRTCGFEAERVLGQSIESGNATHRLCKRPAPHVQHRYDLPCRRKGMSLPKIVFQLTADFTCRAGLPRRIEVPINIDGEQASSRRFAPLGGIAQPSTATRSADQGWLPQ